MARRALSRPAFESSIPLTLLLCALLTLRLFPPDHFPLYPVCPFHALTGLLCPGCGLTHAFAALARGELKQSLASNPLAIPLLLCAAAWAIRPRHLPRPAVFASLAACAAFTVWRNLH